jgi:hypothetical protein
MPRSYLIVRDTGWEGMDKINVTGDREEWRVLVNAVNEPGGSIKCWNIFE